MNFPTYAPEWPLSEDDPAGFDIHITPCGRHQIGVLARRQHLIYEQFTGLLPQLLERELISFPHNA